MREELIKHLGRGRHAYILPTGEAEIIIELGKNDAKEVYLVNYDKYLLNRGDEYKAQYTPMEKCAAGRFTDYYRVRVRPRRHRLHYFFKISFNSGEDKYFDATGLSDSPHFNEFDIFAIPYLNLEDRVEVPEWCRDAVMYQIFPDSFNNEGRNNEANYEAHPAKRYFGGTLNGIRAKIPYLKELGIDVVYLTPIFKANTNHRYDTVDYMEIDPMLGTKEDLKGLVAELHKNNMRIVLDGVFNHTSSYFFAFLDILKNQEKSKYKDWYHIIKFPVERNYDNPLSLSYESFSVSVDMPKLNTCNPEVMSYIFSVIEYWTREFNIDGWRLDVANEVPIYFWRELRRLIKGINKDILLIGESWNDSSAYLDGTSFDSVMNYLFRADLFRLMDSSDINIGINKFIEYYSDHMLMYPSPHFSCLINLIASHDVERLRDIYSYKEIKCMVVLLMTLEGLPCIYYGDELGLKEDSLFNNRAPMPWASLNESSYAFFKELIKIRHSYSALRGNNIKFINRNDGTLEYIRYASKSKIGVLINFNNEAYSANYDNIIYQSSNSLGHLDFVIYKIK